MEKKRGRGRPKASEGWLGENATHFEKIIMSGERRCTRRTVSDTVYAYTAMGILIEAASDIQDLELIFDEKSQYMCRSILNQLGRMYPYVPDRGLQQRGRYNHCERRDTGQEKRWQRKRN